MSRRRALDPEIDVFPTRTREQETREKYGRRLPRLDEIESEPWPPERAGTGSRWEQWRDEL